MLRTHCTDECAVDRACGAGFAQLGDIYSGYTVVPAQYQPHHAKRCECVQWSRRTMTVRN